MHVGRSPSSPTPSPPPDPESPPDPDPPADPGHDPGHDRDHDRDPSPEPGRDPGPAAGPPPDPGAAPSWGVVDEAGWESFPASDPPAYGPPGGATKPGSAPPGPPRPLDAAEREGLIVSLRHARHTLGQTAAIGDHASLAEVRRSQAEAVAALAEAMRRHGLEPDPREPEPAAPLATEPGAAERAARAVYARNLALARDHHSPLISVYAGLCRRADALHLPMLEHLPRRAGEQAPAERAPETHASGTIATK